MIRPTPPPDSAEPAYVVDRTENKEWSHYPMGKQDHYAIVEIKAGGEMTFVEASRLQYVGGERA